MPSKTLLSIALFICLVLPAIPFIPQAGADYPHPMAGNTLYVGTTAKYHTIQAAVNDAIENDTIIVANGTYTETVTVNKANLLLRGNSTKDCIVRYATNGTDPLNTYAAVFNVTTTNVNITGFNIRAYGNATHAIASKYSGSNCTIFGNNITVYGKGDGLSEFASGAMFVLCNDLQVKKNIIRVAANWSHGIYLQSCDKAEVCDNTVNYAASYGFAHMFYQCRNCTIDGNTISMTSSTPRGIWLYSNCQDNVVSNNTITDQGSGGMDLLIDSSHRNTVKYNTITSSAYIGTGIWMPYSSSRNKILNNTITMTNYASVGIELEWDSHDNLIAGNDLDLSGDSAMGVQLHAFSVFNNISKNAIRMTGGTATAITISSSADNLIWGNDLNTSSNDGYCIEISKSERTQIAGGNELNCYADNNHAIRMYQYCNFTDISDSIIRTYGPHGNGIFMDGYSKGVTVHRCDVAVTGAYANALKATHGSMVAYDSKFDATQNKDITGENNAVLTTVNCTFSDVEMSLAAGGTLYVWNYLWLYVMQEGGMVPLPGTDVVIYADGLPAYASAGYGGTDPATDANGSTGKVLVRDRWYDHSNNVIENDTSISVKKTVDRSWEENRTGVDMSTSHCEAFAAADIEAPAMPSGLRIERVGTTNTLNVSWQTVFDALHYEVYTNSSGTWKFMANTTHPQNWTVTASLPDETWYDFKVWAWDNAPGFVSAFSPVVSYYLTDITPPAMPLGLDSAPMPGKDGINVTWTPNTDDTKSYELWWKEQTATAWTKAGNITHPNATYALYDASIVNGTTYEFRLRAFDKVGLCSHFNTNATMVHYDHLAPAAARNLTATTLSESSIRLNWQAPSDLDVAGFVVYINNSEIGLTDQMIGYDISTGLDYTFENLTQNTTYTFAVRAYDEAENLGPGSNKASNTTLKHLYAPRVLQTFPANGSEGVGVDEAVAIVFSLPMDIDSVPDVLSILPIADHTLNWSVGNTILQISFASDLRYNTTYTITIGKAASAEDVFMVEYPFTLTFKTEVQIVTNEPPGITFMSLSQSMITNPNKNLTISVYASDPEGDPFNVYVNLSAIGGSERQMLYDDGNSGDAMAGDNTYSFKFSVPKQTPNGNYTISAWVEQWGSIVGDNMSKTLWVNFISSSDDDDVVDDDDTGPNYGLYAVVGITTFLILMVIIIVIVVLMRRKKAAAEAQKPEPEAKHPPAQEQAEPETPAVTISSPDAIEPEVESKDIFREKDKEAGRKEMQSAAAHAAPMNPPVHNVSQPAPSQSADLGSWPAPAGEAIVPVSDQHPAAGTAGTSIIEDPFKSDLPKVGQPILALPPAQVFESEFEDMPKIDELFIISKTGLLLRHFTYKDTTVVDKDILASMLTVIQNFITDSFGKSDTSLKTMGFGKFNIFIVPGNALSVVVISSEEDLKPLEGPVKGLIQTIETKNKQTLKDWNGNAESLIGIDDAVGEMLNN